ncbi:MAG: hypothetical protein RBG13Loki_1198 [Promethearchaeota archaeon CR_4]|nr:MAG: hypothetical protein RBG13Loki_1198 [Candidatus Lokiarchaeota archaeon CR_4]
MIRLSNLQVDSQEEGGRLIALKEYVVQVNLENQRSIRKIKKKIEKLDEIANRLDRIVRVMKIRTVTTSPQIRILQK